MKYLALLFVFFTFSIFAQTTEEMNQVGIKKTLSKQLIKNLMGL